MLGVETPPERPQRRASAISRFDVSHPDTWRQSKLPSISISTSVRVCNVFVKCNTRFVTIPFGDGYVEADGATNHSKTIWPRRVKTVTQHFKRFFQFLLELTSKPIPSYDVLFRGIFGTYARVLLKPERSTTNYKFFFNNVDDIDAVASERRPIILILQIHRLMLIEWILLHELWESRIENGESSFENWNFAKTLNNRESGLENRDFR